jgi:hypothetical protein
VFKVPPAPATLMTVGVGVNVGGGVVCKGGVVCAVVEEVNAVEGLVAKGGVISATVVVKEVDAGGVAADKEAVIFAGTVVEEEVDEVRICEVAFVVGAAVGAATLPTEVNNYLID